MHYPYLDTQSTPPRILIRPGVTIDLNSSTKALLEEFCEPKDITTIRDTIESEDEARRTVFALKEMEVHWLSISVDKLDQHLLKKMTELRHLDTLLIHSIKTTGKYYSRVDDIVSLFSGMKNLKHLEFNFEVTGICHDLAKDYDFKHQFRLVEKLGVGCPSLRYVQTITDGMTTSWEIEQSMGYGNRWPVPKQKAGQQRLKNSGDVFSKRKSDFNSRRWFGIGSPVATPFNTFSTYPGLPAYSVNAMNPIEQFYQAQYQNQMKSFMPFGYGMYGPDIPFSMPPPAPVMPAWGHELQEYPIWSYDDYNPDDYPDWCVIYLPFLHNSPSTRHRKRHQARPIQKRKTVSFL